MQVKSKILVIYILSALPLPLFAQIDTTNYKWSFNGMAGAGFPQGEFKDTRYANMGPEGFISVSRKFKKSIFDIVSELSYNSNRAGQGYAISNGNYYTINALAGFSITVPQHNSPVSLRLRFLSGLTYSISPYMEYYSKDMLDHIYINSAGALSVPFDVGAMVWMALNKHFFGIIAIDYLNTAVQWNATEKITTNNTSTTQPYKDGTSLNLLDLTAGIGYRFGK